MALQQRQAQVVWMGDLKGNGTISVGSGALGELPVTFAARTEKADGKTSPEELIAAAHATCYAMAFSNTLAKAGAPPERLDIKATCSLDRKPEGGLKITSMELQVVGRVPGLDQPRFEELAREGEKGCPVSNALRNNVEIRLNARLV
ncbi:MAG: OsmC family peroxiredoxin [Chloroflexi bacterium]|nr:OsmC family peroxiredoxin [Chloroflexota bacterium]